MEKIKVLIILMLFAISFLAGVYAEENLTQNSKAGEEYQVLSITTPQTQEKLIWLGIGRECIDEQVIIVLKSQNKNRIIYRIIEQDKTTNLNVSDIIVLTKQDQIIISQKASTK